MAIDKQTPSSLIPNAGHAFSEGVMIVTGATALSFACAAPVVASVVGLAFLFNASSVGFENAKAAAAMEIEQSVSDIRHNGPKTAAVLGLALLLTGGALGAAVGLRRKFGNINTDDGYGFPRLLGAMTVLAVPLSVSLSYDAHQIDLAAAAARSHQQAEKAVDFSVRPLPALRPD